MLHTSPPRLAWFTPLPPVRSGVAQYNLELLPGLTAAHEVDVFVDGHPDAFARPDSAAATYSAHDFVWKHYRRPYDLVVYQLGNAPCHDYMWPYFTRYPGLVVLHDGQLHHARGRQLLGERRTDDYRTEFAFNHPDAEPALAELGIAGLLGSLTYLWPMRRIAVEFARFVAVHNQWLGDRIREEHPGARISVIDMGVPDAAVGPGAAARVRARHGIPADAVLLLALGDVTPEKRISQLIQGLASIVNGATQPDAPDVHLLLAGKAVAHYDAGAEAHALGVADRVTIAGFVPHDEVAAYLTAADVCLCMRWPTSRETSAAWLRCLAAGRPTITTDLVHMTDIPAYDPRTWTVLHEPTATPDGETPSRAANPVAVGIDILDEDHSLRLALRRLTTDRRLRERLGRNARQLWADRFTLDRMVSRYHDVVAQALSAPQPDAEARAALPPHFLTTGTEHADRLLRAMGLPESRIDEIWHH